MQGWTCTYMQRNTKRTNTNHWMENNKVDGWMSLSHGSKGPPSTWIMSNRLQTSLKELLHTVHHIMAVDPMPGDKVPGRLASPRSAGLTLRLFGPIQLGSYSNRCCKRNPRRPIKSRWIGRSASLQLPCHVSSFGRWFP
jgi:hypothetical protein